MKGGIKPDLKQWFPPLSHVKRGQGKVKAEERYVAVCGEHVGTMVVPEGIPRTCMLGRFPDVLRVSLP